MESERETTEEIEKFAERSLEGTINCVDLGLDDIPDACGTRTADDEEFGMLSPPPEDLSRWFGETLREAAKRMDH